MKALNIIMQIGILAVISFMGSFMADNFDLGIPGSIYGIVILLALIKLQVIPIEKIERGADFLLAELLLFFIPSAIGVIEFQDILAGELLQLLMTLGVSIIMLLGLVGLVSELTFKLREGRRA